ncbi:MAG: hypothetical protein R3B72_32245 [Polyangiaceae bacterium]
MSTLVLKDSVTRDDVDDAMAALGYRLTNVVPAGPGQPAQLIFSQPAGKVVAHVIDDQRLRVTYLAVQGEAAEPARDALAERLVALAPEAQAEILEGLPSASGASPELLRALASLVLQEPDGPRLDRHLEAALRHPDPQLRVAGLTAVTYRPRAALRPALDAIAEGDPEPTLRQAAGQILSQLEVTA